MIQDGYDLPPDLKDFLFARADERDFASLQVVFGRGNEFFASDANGKLEFKEPEPEKKDPTPGELEEKRALRRSRTLSFMRPRSDEGSRQNVLDLDSQSPASSRRSSLINGRPPSLSLSFRSNSDASLHTLNSQPESRPSSVSHTRLSSDASVGSQLWSRPSSAQTTTTSRPTSDMDMKTDEVASESYTEERPIVPPPIPPSTQSTKRLRPLSMSFKGGLIPRIPEGRQVPQGSSSAPPPLPPLPKALPLPLALPAKRWTAQDESPSSSPPSVRPLQLNKQTVDQESSTRSISPPFQMPEQTESPVLPAEARNSLSLGDVSTVAPTSLINVPPARLSLHDSDSIAIAPAVPSASNTPPPPPTLSIQIISTTAQTSPISPTPAPLIAPLPQRLSMHFTALSTSPISPPPPSQAALQPHIPISTSSTHTQTTPPASPLRTALRLNTNMSFPKHTYSFSTSSSALDIDTPQDYQEDSPGAYFDTPPVFMGRMMDYYSKPGYQLGQSLLGGYVGGEVVVQGEGDGDGELTEWERANGRGY